ncbi:nitroreductase [Streptomyces sp. NBC_01443]|uniref:nitroreductase family protein n=1 Tax=Streptomyces sp. NBC_01443 TaxID=2903868 RepID=UPI002258AE81|nr:nitroreductase [Streptomyces sp. NBC_01443]MCX4632908.1 nitroreductase [Streptomyces sp. NBC_01443]
MNPDPVPDAVLTRRSILHLTAPAPTRTQLEDLVQAAATAPDHGQLRPWRLIPVTGDERARLGEALGEATPPEHAHRASTKTLRAPLLLTIVHCPAPDHVRVPPWEQLAATTAVITTLSLLLHSRGWGSIWRTGPAIEAPQVRKYLGLEYGEQLLGWLYIGTPLQPDAVRARSLPDVRTKISWEYTDDNR